MNSLAQTIKNAILTHYNGEGGGLTLDRAIEDAIREGFDVRRREVWTRPTVFYTTGEQ